MKMMKPPEKKKAGREPPGSPTCLKPDIFQNSKTDVTNLPEREAGQDLEVDREQDERADPPEREV